MMDGDMWLAFWHKGCYKGGVLGDYFYKKTFFFPSYHFAPVFFHVTFWEKIAPEKEKNNPGLDFGPKRKKNS